MHRALETILTEKGLIDPAAGRIGAAIERSMPACCPVCSLRFWFCT
jgi:hypothetical protein